MSSNGSDANNRSDSSENKPTPLDAETVLDAAGEGILVVDRDLKILWMNRRFRELATSRNGSLPSANTTCFEFMHNRGEPCLQCEALKTFQTGQQASCIHHSPEDKYWESVASPIFDNQGNVNQAVMVVRDVTERVFLEGRIESIYLMGLELSRLDPTQLAGKNIDERIEIIKVNVIRHTQKLIPLDSLVIRQLDERTGELKVMIREGYDPVTDDALRRKKIFVNAEGQGITGYVAATGKSYLCQDTRTDPLVKEPTVEFRTQIALIEPDLELNF